MDYMAEHLTPGGRAGIIVPEGIIFQSQTAYRQLRKLLVEDYLVAVVSLPAGVFNPYSGVKTSILILDKALARKTDRIAFFKVESDGFDLGAQRRPIGKNDLPQARTELIEYLDHLRTGESVEDFHCALGIVVEKRKVSEDGEYNLSGERYKENRARVHKFPVARIGDICIIDPPKSELANLSPDTPVSFVPMADLNENRVAFQPKQEKLLSEVSGSYTYFADDDVLLARVTPCFENGKVGIARGLLNGVGFGSSEFFVLRCGEDILSEWMYFCIMHPLFRNWAIHQMTGTGGLQRVPRSSVAGFQIPLPPLEVQREIVSEIEGYERVIQGARTVVENYRPHIVVDPEWPTVALGDVCDSILGGGTPSTKNEEYWNGDIPWITSADIVDIKTANPRKHITAEAIDHSATNLIPKGNIIVSTRVGLGKLFRNDFDVCISQDSQGLILKKGVDADYMVYSLIDKVADFKRVSRGSTIQGVTKSQLSELKIPLPPLSQQRVIVREAEEERALVYGNRELINRFEEKIQAAIGRVWGA